MTQCLSDGEALYVFRNTEYDEENPDFYNLSYKDFSDGFVGVKTHSTFEGGYRLSQYDLVEIPRHGEIVTYLNIFDEEVYTSGTITENTSWSEDHYLIGDLIIPAGITLEIEDGACLYFAGRHNVKVYGELSFNEGSELQLSHHSSVAALGSDALLFFDWDTSISGYEENLRSVEFPGDRIMSRDGGEIRLGDIVYYVDQPPIVVYSRSDKKWNGFEIEANTGEYTCEFANCDVSGIAGITMAGGNNNGYLNIYYSSFDDCNSIYARDIELLTIAGNDGNHCEFTNFSSYPVFAHSSDIDIQYSDFYENDNDAIHLVYQPIGDEDIGIFNCNIYDNGGNGIYLYSSYVYDCVDNYIYDNDKHGVYGWDGHFWHSFSDNIVENNLQSEFIGKSDFFTHVVNGDNTFNDPDPNNGGNWDQYVLASLDWEIGDDQIPVYGNTISQQNDHTRFYPCWEAFDFTSEAEKSEESQQLDLALGYIQDLEFDSANPVLTDLIENYSESKEAVYALKALYYIENQTEGNFSELRDYIATIQADSLSYLASAKENIVIKTYLKEKNYLTAIADLEERIANLTVEDEILYAQLDEAYCEMMITLAEEDRSSWDELPSKLSPLQDYFAIVADLESQHSTFESEEQPDSECVNSTGLVHFCYPNPFNPTTTIYYKLTEAAKVNVVVYNIKGQLVKTLENSILPEGSHSCIWDGSDETGKQVSSGVFLYKISIKNQTATGKVLMLK